MKHKKLLGAGVVALSLAAGLATTAGASTDTTEPAGTDTVAPSGECESVDSVSLQLQWFVQSQFAGYLVARDNDGPNIPCAAAIALTNKIAAGTELPPGARPCMGLLSVEDLLEPLAGFSIREVVPPTLA